MNNKKKAFYLTAFIACLFAIIGTIAIAEHLPLIGKPLVFILTIVLVIFIIIAYIIIMRRSKK